MESRFFLPESQRKIGPGHLFLNSQSPPGIKKSPLIAATPHGEAHYDSISRNHTPALKPPVTKSSASSMLHASGP